jgi:hypothetical protein
MINKLIFAVNVACILCALIIAHEYHDAKAANSAKLASEIKAAREQAWEMVHDTAFQKALLDREIHDLEPMIPDIALQPIKARAR